MKVNVKGKYIFLICVVFVCGIFVGFLTTNFQYINEKNIWEGNADFNYGIESQNLTVSEVSWQENASFRKVSFVLDGEFVVNVPADCTCVISDIEDSANLKEINREKNYGSRGEGQIAYDQVRYQLNHAKIQSEGILKGEDAIHDAISGYRLIIIFGANEETIGYLPPSEDHFLDWSEEENYFSSNNYEMYLEHFGLSETYNTDYDMNTNQQAEDIKLIKKEGSVLNYIIDNTNGSGDWEYNAQLPTIELWYQGAWLEMDSPFENNLAVGVCYQGESREIDAPEDTMKQYSYFLPGIYRLVLWGTDGSYIATDSFVIEDNTDPLSFWFE